jgi:N-acetylglucosaminyl-diphospho-decaprenol L-rhamnosyltransferase
LPRFEAIVVDNDSTDGLAEALRLPDDRFPLHLARANLGFAAANNLAAADCKTPWVVTLNPDAIAGKTWLEELRNATVRPSRRQDVRLDPARCAEARSG